MHSIAAGARRADLKMPQGDGVAMVMPALEDPCANTGNALASPDKHRAFFCEELGGLTFGKIKSFSSATVVLRCFYRPYGSILHNTATLAGVASDKE
ncbi:hypothetical protein [Sphingobium sp. 15-1]|uniref:hypothetical protein n=1 Tax=Sphingobium sp. 15-1 TaxID=2729616 RepID=UPI00159C2A11|nr:hypothetical protein [Sphingobium sp. 15-1]